MLEILIVIVSLDHDLISICHKYNRKHNRTTMSFKFKYLKDLPGQKNSHAGGSFFNWTQQLNKSPAVMDWVPTILTIEFCFKCECSWHLRLNQILICHCWNAAAFRVPCLYVDSLVELSACQSFYAGICENPRFDYVFREFLNCYYVCAIFICMVGTVNFSETIRPRYLMALSVLFWSEYLLW